MCPSLICARELHMYPSLICGKESQFRSGLLEKFDFGLFVEALGEHHIRSEASGLGS